MSIKYARTFLILPVCMLLLNALEEVAVYRLRGAFTNDYFYIAALIGMFALGFSLVGDFLVPWLRNLVEKAHTGSKKFGGYLGILIFYSLTLAGIFILYYVIYVKGAHNLLPSDWR